MGRLLQGDGDLEGLIVLLHWREEKGDRPREGPPPSPRPHPGEKRWGGQGPSFLTRPAPAAPVVHSAASRGPRLPSTSETLDRKSGHPRRWAVSSGLRGTPGFDGGGNPEPSGLLREDSWTNPRVPGQERGTMEGTSWPEGVTPGREVHGEMIPTSRHGVGVQPTRPPHPARGSKHAPSPWWWEAGRVRSAGEGHAWGCAPALCPAGGRRTKVARGPNLGCATRSRPGPALTHPRVESGPGTDRGGGGAHARRRGASAKCRGERREAPTQRRGRRGGQGRTRDPPAGAPPPGSPGPR